MKRRFLQFSLRGLLGFGLLVCLVLGGWHLLETYGNRLDIEDVRIGEPIRAKAGYFWLFGPRECQLELGYRTADLSPILAGGDRTYGTYDGEPGKRSWGCLYTMESELEPIDHPCQLIFAFNWFENAQSRGGTPMWTLEKIVDVK